MGQMYFPGELNNDCSAEIEKIWAEHNVSEYGEKGMRIHVAFDVNGLQNIPIAVAVYFYYATGNPLIDTNKKFCTAEGHVATHTYVTPSYGKCHYDDISVFMPYNELHLLCECTCYFFIQIWNGSEMLATSKQKNFYLRIG